MQVLAKFFSSWCQEKTKLHLCILFPFHLLFNFLCNELDKHLKNSFYESTHLKMLKFMLKGERERERWRKQNICDQVNLKFSQLKKKLNDVLYHLTIQNIQCFKIYTLIVAEKVYDFKDSVHQGISKYF
jgi:hypothetical protein